ncbi:hypothetical protein Moror_7554 [Moniliophthora roreri MCA 2997]|uniref:Uncharacterized protein n=2 Tax=Moniliophthora roreri TaxID=221103 RepID=V2XWY3_MONRO|nr:hypothetical protein Moror_7554 [Moniliophthora roreri MCA 2997]
MSNISQTQDFSVKIEMLRVKALAMEFERSPLFPTIKSKTRNPKTTLVIPAETLPMPPARAPITLMDAFFQIQEEEHQKRYGKRYQTLMDEILNGRDAAKQARKPRNGELDSGVLADVEETGEEDVDDDSESDFWESDEEVPQNEVWDQENPTVGSFQVRSGNSDYNGDAENDDVHGYTTCTSPTSDGLSFDGDVDENSPPVIVFPDFDSDSDKGNNASLTTVPATLHSVFGDIHATDNGDANKENTPPLLDHEDKENVSPFTTSTRSYPCNVLKDVPGSIFDEVKENRVPVPASIATTAQSGQKVLADTTIPDSAETPGPHDEDKDTLVSPSKQYCEMLSDDFEVGLSLIPRTSGSPRDPLKQLEFRNEEERESDGGEGRGRAGQPLSTIHLHRKSIIEVSPTRETVMDKENDKAEVPSLPKLLCHVSPNRNALTDSGKQ